jgi:peptide chain release factor 2
MESDIDADLHYARKADDLNALLDLAGEGEDVIQELSSEVDRLIEETRHTEIRMLLSGEHDAANAIVTIHPGAGGVDSQDWADMLVRMYSRWGERGGYTVKLLDYQPGDEAGIRSATLIIEGEFAYGYLSSESGVHRLVRISPFGAMGKRQTSFASVFLYPQLDEKIEIQIDEKDLRIDTYRSSGAGGQHVNVTDSAVRITHIPTGIVVSCQNERSQIRNREMARQVLRSRLYDLELSKKRQEMQEVEDSKMDINFGSQIRSYVLHPYRMVKDHRTKFETSNADRVLDGDIEDFIYQFLVYRGVRS